MSKIKGVGGVIIDPEIMLDTIMRGYKSKYRGRRDNTIHASNLSALCAREYALCVLHRAYYNDTQITTSATYVTFDIGRGIHNSLRASLADQRILIGNWACRKCNKVTFGAGAVNCACGGSTDYREISFRIEDHGFPISGSPDAILDLGGDKAVIMEIKSISGDEFDKLTEPKIDHTCQLSSYLWLAEESVIRYPVDIHTKQGLVVYVSKLHKQQPIKIYVVDKNTDFLRAVRRELRKLKIFSQDATKLPGRLCSTPMATMAKRCKASVQCFKGEDLWRQKIEKREPKKKERRVMRVS